MSDLIDRQAAITALTFAKETGTMKCGELKGVIEVLNRLPSAGPTFDARDTQYNLPIGTDCISRQQAVDALERAKQNIRHNIERAIGRAICEILDEVENGIKQLPPIQPKLLQPGEVLVAQAVLPQPKRGKWICTGEPDESWGMMYECSICGNHDYGGNYCSYCGAKMEDENE